MNRTSILVEARAKQEKEVLLVVAHLVKLAAGSVPCVRSLMTCCRCRSSVAS
nr:MAG TPA: hypothetical protein [Caudoviricetes sp.]